MKVKVPQALARVWTGSQGACRNDKILLMITVNGIERYSQSGVLGV